MTTLRMMVGVPGAGKSHFIKMAKNQKDLVVSRDAIRFQYITPGIPYFSQEKKVFNAFVKAINEGALNHDVVWADATHITPGSRHKLYSKIDKESFDKLELYVINTSLENCLKNNSKREGLAKVPEDQIKDMFSKFVYPTEDEFTDIECSIINIEIIFNEV